MKLVTINNVPENDSLSTFNIFYSCMSISMKILKLGHVLKDSV